jgi:hypothetical protein
MKSRGLNCFVCLTRKTIFSSRFSKPIWISEDDQMLMECKSQRKGKMYLVFYSFKNGTFNSPMTGNISGITREWITPEVYTESLVSPCF